MRLLRNPNIDFIGLRRYGYIFSGVTLVVGILFVLIGGLHYGIDFKGGKEYVVRFAQPRSVADVRSTLTPALGKSPEVKTYGDDRTLLIRTDVEGDLNEIQARIIEALERTQPGNRPEVLSTSIVGPRFAADLRKGALYSAIGSLIVIFLYIMIRFEWRFGLSALLTLAHDVIVVLGLFTILEPITPFSIEISQTIIAAFLTIIGYSVNDTVIIYDRIREYRNIFKTERLDVLINRALNATLSRTIITSGTTLLVILVLFIFGGEALRGFAFALFLGIGLGTYSSIFVSSPFVYELYRYQQRRAQSAVAVRSTGPRARK